MILIFIQLQVCNNAVETVERYVVFKEKILNNGNIWNKN